MSTASYTQLPRQYHFLDANVHIIFNMPNPKYWFFLISRTLFPQSCPYHISKTKILLFHFLWSGIANNGSSDIHTLKFICWMFCMGPSSSTLLQVFDQILLYRKALLDHPEITVFLSTIITFLLELIFPLTFDLT